MANCPPDRCLPAFDDPRANITGTAFVSVEQDCRPEEGILLLTDDAGLLSTSDATLGYFMDADTETQTISSLADALLHYTPCNPIYWDLFCFFAESERPAKITLGLVQSGETLSDAFTRITKCPICAASVQTTAYKADGTTWIDTAEYVAFTNLIDTEEDWHHHGLTFEASSAFADMFETTSVASSVSHQEQEWVVADVGCRFAYEVDANGDCVASVDVDGNNIQESYYLNAALTAAGFDAFHSTLDPDYNYSTNSVPSGGCHTGVFLDETTGTSGDLDTYDVIDLGATGQGGLVNLTGLTDAVGAPLTGVTRHLNAFVRISNGRQESVRYLSSIYVSGENYGDVWYKEKAINDDIRAAVLAWKDEVGTDLTEAGQRAEALQIKLILDSWIGKRVINGDVYEWLGYTNVIVNGQRGNGEGYVIAATPASSLNTTDIATRAASFIQYCFRVNSPQHGSTIQVCKVPPITLGV